MGGSSRGHPLRFRRIVEFAHRAGYNPILTKSDLYTGLAPDVRSDSIPIAWDKCVQIDKMRYAFRDVLQCACDDKAAV
jgi:hypothetical protein